MRYFKDTVPVKTVFLTVCNGWVSYCGLPTLAYIWRNTGKVEIRSPFVDVRVVVVQSRVRKGK